LHLCPEPIQDVTNSSVGRRKFKALTAEHGNNFFHIMTETNQLFPKPIMKSLSFFTLSLLHFLLFLLKSGVRSFQIIEIIVETALVGNQSPLMAFDLRNLAIESNKLCS
jgi:hypothetical protein